MVVTLIETLLLVPATIALILASNFCLQIVGSLLPENSDATEADERVPFLVIIPAHNEEAGIRSTLSSVKAHLTPQDRLIVVADNCDDNTAIVSADAGAEVTERRDDVHTGKGYALAHGVNFANEFSSGKAIIFVDADCQIEEGSLSQLASVACSLERPAQGLYLMRAPKGGSPLMVVSEFAGLIKNYVRPLGADRLGWPCQLMGSGMAFPASMLRDIDLASGHIVEDMKLGADLALKGIFPKFCPEVVVSTTYAESAKGHEKQRVRWEHGHLTMIASYVPKMLAGALVRWSPSLAWMAFDIAIPPIAAFIVALVLLALLAVVFAGLTGEVLPLLLLLAANFILSAALLIAWQWWGSSRLHVLQLLRVAPAYIFKKLPILWRFIRKRETKWVRSERKDA